MDFLQYYIIDIYLPSIYMITPRSLLPPHTELQSSQSFPILHLSYIVSQSVTDSLSLSPLPTPFLFKYRHLHKNFLLQAWIGPLVKLKSDIS